jgi:hypothetical protein
MSERAHFKTQLNDISEIKYNTEQVSAILDAFVNIFQKMVFCVCANVHVDRNVNCSLSFLRA